MESIRNSVRSIVQYMKHDTKNIKCFIPTDETESEHYITKTELEDHMELQKFPEILRDRGDVLKVRDLYPILQECMDEMKEDFRLPKSGKLDKTFDEIRKDPFINLTIVFNPKQQKATLIWTDTREEKVEIDQYNFADEVELTKTSTGTNTVAFDA